MAFVDRELRIDNCWYPTRSWRLYCTEVLPSWYGELLEWYFWDDERKLVKLQLKYGVEISWTPPFDVNTITIITSPTEAAMPQPHRNTITDKNING